MLARRSKLAFLSLLGIASYFAINLNNSSYYLMRQVSSNNFRNNRFNYLINPGHRICEDTNEVTLLAFVVIRSDAFQNRLLHRTTWASRTMFPQIRVVFMIGMSKNSTINYLVHQENELYGDIVQEDYLDSYRNLTLKTISGIKWASQFCSNAKFVMKIDDDMLLNTYQLLKYLDNLVVTHSVQENAFYCKPLYNNTVIRVKSSHLYVSREDYPFNNYHTYCQGMAYIFPVNMAHRLYEKSLSTKLLPMEDVYIGLLGKQLNAEFIDIWDHYYYDWYHLEDRKNGFVNFKSFNFDDRFIIFLQDYDKDFLDLIPIWKLLVKRFYELVFNYHL